MPNELIGLTTPNIIFVEGVRDIFTHDYVEEVAGAIVGAEHAARFVARVADLTRRAVCV